jgi:hypothetical protein
MRKAFLIASFLIGICIPIAIEITRMPGDWVVVAFWPSSLWLMALDNASRSHRIIGLVVSIISNGAWYLAIGAIFFASADALLQDNEP